MLRTAPMISRLSAPLVGNSRAARNYGVCRPLQRTPGPLGGAVGMMRDGLAAELEGEPCVEEFLKLPPG
jgi:hypothetical protein